MAELKQIVRRIRDWTTKFQVILIFAHNRTGKTRLSEKFIRHKKSNKDTLYFNAFTEDLFIWDNDLELGNNRFLRMNSGSQFITGTKGLALEAKIESYFYKYCDISFKIDYESYLISFSKKYYNSQRNKQTELSDIKISRGEETVFKFCFFLAICQLALDDDENFNWVKYIYIDDPISSLDENNAISVGCDIARLISEYFRSGGDNIRFIISTHHSLFFNCIFNEIKHARHVEKKAIQLTSSSPVDFSTVSTDDLPVFHHLLIIAELSKASESGKVYTYHFNALRSLLEKIAAFHGYRHFSEVIGDLENELLFSRAVNILSHGSHSVFEPREMVPDNIELFRRILKNVLSRFALPSKTLL